MLECGIESINRGTLLHTKISYSTFQGQNISKKLLL